MKVSDLAVDRCSKGQMRGGRGEELMKETAPLRDFIASTLQNREKRIVFRKN